MAFDLGEWKCQRMARQAQIDHIPPSFKSAIPSDTLKLNATGTQHSMDLRLTGGPEVDARLVAMAKTDWATWLAAPLVFPNTCRRSLTPGDHGCLAHPSA